MKLSSNAQVEVDLALEALQQCKDVSGAQLYWIQRAENHVREAKEWIVASQLKDKLVNDR